MHDVCRVFVNGGKRGSCCIQATFMVQPVIGGSKVARILLPSATSVRPSAYASTGLVEGRACPAELASGDPFPNCRSIVACRWYTVSVPTRKSAISARRHALVAAFYATKNGRRWEGPGVSRSFPPRPIARRYLRRSRDRPTAAAQTDASPATGRCPAAVRSTATRTRLNPASAGRQSPAGFAISASF